jgi:hypothetical protein
MPEFHHLSGEALEPLNQLAELTRAALEIAGIPVHLLSGPSSTSGAEIEIDTGDDEGGGVYVHWHSDRRLRDEAADCVRRRQFTDPIIKHSGSISLHMRDAIIGILSSAGFVAEESRDDLRPLTVRVVAAPAEGESWLGLISPT